MLNQPKREIKINDRVAVIDGIGLVYQVEEINDGVAKLWNISYNAFDKVEVSKLKHA